MIKVEIKGATAVAARMRGAGKQIRYAAMRSLNSMAFDINADVKREMRTRFKGGATPYSLRAMNVYKATKENLVAVVRLRDDGPGKGTPYSKALAHLFVGGTRRWKRMEGAFRSIGVLDSGRIMVVPKGDSWANPLDGYGNPKPGLITQLISYFGAFGEQGFRANMTKKRKDRLAKRGVSAAGYKTINGVVYFISRGRGMWYGRQQHLAAGIWAKRGTHGSDVAPVFLFVRQGNYQQIIDLEGIGQAVVDDRWHPVFKRELETALRNAR